MYASETTELFRGIMKKLAKKDKERYERVMGKVQEILENPASQKPLGNVMAGIRRAHIDPYVLTYRVFEQQHKVLFLNFDHHDKVY